MDFLGEVWHLEKPAPVESVGVRRQAYLQQIHMVNSFLFFKERTNIQRKSKECQYPISEKLKNNY